MRFRDRILKFMYGRYGADQLYTFLVVITLILTIAKFFTDSIILSVVICLLWGWILFRMLSRNIYARQRENNFYLKIKNGIVGFFSLRKRKWKDRKTHVYKKCPHCKATLRLPKKKGKHGVNCPKCKEHFEVKI